MEDAAKSSTEIGRENSATFDIVDIDSRSARVISDYSSEVLRRRFGFGSTGPGRAVIGVGDKLVVTIFEASADGLFSTAKKKQTGVEVVVQPDGSAAIPYVGTVRFAGKTIEESRETILATLVGKAVEPDVIVASVNAPSRSVTVSGAVAASGQIPLNLSGERVTNVIAKAGGPTAQPFETHVTLVRGKRVGTVLLKSIVENPAENVFVQPGDKIFIMRDPRSFTISGAVARNGRLAFGANDINLLEAIALAGGGSDKNLDATGYFLFRYEEPEVLVGLLGQARFDVLVRKGMTANREGRYPIVYRFNMTHPDSLLVGQTFSIKDRDVIYASRHPSVELLKFLRIVGAPLGIASQGAGVATKLDSVE